MFNESCKWLVLPVDMNFLSEGFTESYLKTTWLNEKGGPLEQFKINSTNSLELNLTWQPVLSRPLTFWLPVMVYLFVLPPRSFQKVDAFLRNGLGLSSWDPVSLQICSVQFSGSHVPNLSSASFKRFSSNSFSAYIPVFSQHACTVHEEMPEMDRVEAAKSMWICAVMCQIPKWSWSGCIYIFTLSPFSSAPLLGTSHHKGMIALF